MGVATCTRCGATAEGSTFKEASDKLDHGIGMVRNRPCPNDPAQYPVSWSGPTTKSVKVTAEPEPKTPPKPAKKS